MNIVVAHNISDTVVIAYEGNGKPELTLQVCASEAAPMPVI